MSVAIAITGVFPPYGTGSAGAVADKTNNEIIVDGTLTLSGTYGTSSSHGDPVNFAGVNPPFAFGDYAPVKMEVFEAPVAGSAATGFRFIYCPGPTLAAPTQAGGVLQVIGTGASSGAGGTEITQAAAYSSQSPSLASAVLRFRAWFYRL